MTFSEVIVVAIVTGLAALGGAWLTDRNARIREEAARIQAGRQAADARVRDALLRDLEETRQVLVGNLAYLEKAVVLGQPETTPNDWSALTRYNINLVGDVEAVRAYDDLTRELAAKLPTTFKSASRAVVRAALPLKLNIDPALIERTTRVRAVLLAALDAQEDRARRDEPLRKLTPDELATIGGVDAMLEVLTERVGRPRP